VNRAWKRIETLIPMQPFILRGSRMRHYSYDQSARLTNQTSQCHYSDCFGRRVFADTKVSCLGGSEIIPAADDNALSSCRSSRSLLAVSEGDKVVPLRKGERVELLRGLSPTIVVLSLFWVIVCLTVASCGEKRKTVAVTGSVVYADSGNPVSQFEIGWKPGYRDKTAKFRTIQKSKLPGVTILDIDEDIPAFKAVDNGKGKFSFKDVTEGLVTFFVRLPDGSTFAHGCKVPDEVPVSIELDPSLLLPSETKGKALSESARNLE